MQTFVGILLFLCGIAVLLLALSDLLWTTFLEGGPPLTKRICHFAFRPTLHFCRGKNRKVIGIANRRLALVVQANSLPAQLPQVIAALITRNMSWSGVKAWTRICHFAFRRTLIFCRGQDRKIIGFAGLTASAVSVCH